MCFDYPQEQILSALSHSDNLKYQAESQGILKARKVVCEIYEQQGIKVDPENVFLTASTSEAYSYIFRLIANPKDSILFPSPSYPLFQFLGELNDVDLKYYSLVYDQGWAIDFMELERNLSANTKAIVLVNPNNPTGSYVSIEEIDQLNKFCESRGMALM